MTKELSVWLFLGMFAGLFVVFRWVYLKSLGKAGERLPERIIKDYGYLGVATTIFITPLTVLIPFKVVEMVGGWQ